MFAQERLSLAHSSNYESQQLLCTNTFATATYFIGVVLVFVHENDADFNDFECEVKKKRILNCSACKSNCHLHRVCSNKIQYRKYRQLIFLGRTRDIIFGRTRLKTFITHKKNVSESK